MASGYVTEGGGGWQQYLNRFGTIACIGWGEKNCYIIYDGVDLLLQNVMEGGGRGSKRVRIVLHN